MSIKPYDSEIATWRYPRDKAKIGRLSIEFFQMWYLTQNKEHMVFLGQLDEFKSFVFWHYTLKVKALRFWYKIKRNLSGTV